MRKLRVGVADHNHNPSCGFGVLDLSLPNAVSGSARSELDNSIGTSSHVYARPGRGDNCWASTDLHCTNTGSK
jgi:hypothetical protein